MKFVFKHNFSGKYLRYTSGGGKLVDDIMKAYIFNENDYYIPNLPDYTYINYEKEVRKLKLKKLKSL